MGKRLINYQTNWKKFPLYWLTALAVTLALCWWDTYDGSLELLVNFLYGITLGYASWYLALEPIPQKVKSDGGSEGV